MLRDLRRTHAICAYNKAENTATEVTPVRIKVVDSDRTAHTPVIDSGPEKDAVQNDQYGFAAISLRK